MWKKKLEPLNDDEQLIVYHAFLLIKAVVGNHPSKSRVMMGLQAILVRHGMLPSTEGLPQS